MKSTYIYKRINNSDRTFVAVTCKNCGKKVEKKYCSECGQSVRISRINFSFILFDIQDGFIHANKGIFYTIKRLLINPGKMVREYLQGKRVKHFKPLSLLILVSALYMVFFRYVFNFGSVNTIEVVDSEQLSSFFRWLFNNKAIYEILLILLTSVLTFVLYKKHYNYNFIEHIIINTYGASLRILVHFFFLFFVKLEVVLGLDLNVNIIEYLITSYVFFWFYITFFNRSTKLSVIIKSLVTILGIIVTLIILTGLIFLNSKGMVNFDL